ncbi:hypothetical protein [Desulfocicer vacuolatum]|uniref:hypothetical protein n=1 Tax=Desulfocicer vacuolatum TaxID=2298 RepID=UPI0009FDA489|nr:hypothetical protein [Desulfocicer vacuolatum]
MSEATNIENGYYANTGMIGLMLVAQAHRDNPKIIRHTLCKLIYGKTGTNGDKYYFRFIDADNIYYVNFFLK